MAKVEMDGYTFPSKKALHESCKKLLYRVTLNKNLQGEDLDFMIAVLKRHKRYCNLPVSKENTKIWVGVNEMNPMYRTFMCKYKSRKPDNFSYYVAVTQRSQKQSVLSEFRRTVKEDMHSYKKLVFMSDPDQVCAISGVPVNMKSAELDHYPVTFMEIVDLYLDKIGKTYSDIELTTFDAQYGHSFKDKFHGQMFPKFHNDVVSYRILSKKEHRKLSGKKAVTARDL